MKIENAVEYLIEHINKEIKFHNKQIDYSKNYIVEDVNNGYFNNIECYQDEIKTHKQQIVICREKINVLELALELCKNCED